MSPAEISETAVGVYAAEPDCATALAEAASRHALGDSCPRCGAMVYLFDDRRTAASMMLANTAPSVELPLSLHGRDDDDIELTAYRQRFTHLAWRTE